MDMCVYLPRLVRGVMRSFESKWLRRNGGSEEPLVRVLSVRAASEVKVKPALEPSRTPPPNEAMGRITVDTREKEGLH
jgi:hypothetical protein